MREGRKRRRFDLGRMALVLAALGVLGIVAAAVAYAQLGGTPLNDLFALGQGTGDSPAKVPIVQRAEPPLVATPLVPCGPGSHPEPGVDGRVPAGSAAAGSTATSRLSPIRAPRAASRSSATSTPHGHDCAYYDTTLLFPLNALNPGAGSAGVEVLDMSNPAHPTQTDTLTTLPMLSPHESLNLNPARACSRPSTATPRPSPDSSPSTTSTPTAATRCSSRSLPVARFGHESGFSSDGKTFYATSTALAGDHRDRRHRPQAPARAVWQGNVYSHGMTLSDDGNRAYIADPKGNLLILDTSQIQARVANPHAREISRLTWTSASIPQNAIPFTENGHPYLLEFDEYNAGDAVADRQPRHRRRRTDHRHLDETKPFVVSNLRLQIDQPADHAAATAAGDPGTSNAAQGYAAHYCNIPTRVNPKVVACSFIASGLRVFDISNLVKPKEIGYYVAPPQPRSENEYMASDFAMSKPAFVARAARDLVDRRHDRLLCAPRLGERLAPRGGREAAQEEVSQAQGLQAQQAPSPCGEARGPPLHGVAGELQPRGVAAHEAGGRALRDLPARSRRAGGVEAEARDDQEGMRWVGIDGDPSPGAGQSPALEARRGERRAEQAGAVEDVGDRSRAVVCGVGEAGVPTAVAVGLVPDRVAGGDQRADRGRRARRRIRTACDEARDAGGRGRRRREVGRGEAPGRRRGGRDGGGRDHDRARCDERDDPASTRLEGAHGALIDGPCRDRHS